MYETTSATPIRRRDDLLVTVLSEIRKVNLEPVFSQFVNLSGAYYMM
jgi:hypothetical protein